VENLNDLIVAEAADPNNLMLRLEHFRQDPWYFAIRCVFTKDEVDRKMPTKAFPAHLDYLKLYFQLWQEVKFLAVPKSRRMFMTWANITLYLWDTVFHLGRNNAFVSKKEDDSDELVKKAKFILDNIPEHEIPKDLLPRYKYTQCKLEFASIDSIIRGFPSGADQLRQFTFSGILGDEVAFWDNAEQMYAASFPTLEGGGRMTLVSSPAPGFFKRLVFDMLDRSYR
jgi:hypothetical protein